MRIGVITDCFKVSHLDAIKKAGELGLSGVQIYATGGDFTPNMSEEKKEEYRAALAAAGLTVSALCADMGGYGFERAEDNAARIEATCRIIDLACEFGAPVITTHIGVIPADKQEARYAVMLSALTEIGRYAKAHGVTAAIETGPETAATLLAFLKGTDGGVGVNLDPANFRMVTGQDPVEAVHLLGEYIVHTHAKDGIMLEKQDPTAVYHAFAEGGIDALNVMSGFREVPLGEGQVDFPAYIAALREIGYDGYLTIEREAGDDPAADIILAANFLKALLA